MPLALHPLKLPIVIQTWLGSLGGQNSREAAIAAIMVMPGQERRVRFGPGALRDEAPPAMKRSTSWSSALSS